MTENITIEYIENKIKENEPTFKKIFNENDCAYAILQLPIECDYKFRGFDYLVNKLHKMPEREDYNLVYANIIDQTKIDYTLSSKGIADEIFYMFNIPNRPGFAENYYGTSVSVSDIIVVKCGKMIFAFYVDTFGFERIVNFEV